MNKRKAIADMLVPNGSIDRIDSNDIDRTQRQDRFTIINVTEDFQQSLLDYINRTAPVSVEILGQIFSRDIDDIRQQLNILLGNHSIKLDSSECVVFSLVQVNVNSIDLKRSNKH
jgi:hypothetical protein